MWSSGLRYNERELKYESVKRGEKEARLNYKSPKDHSYKERWFKLKSNILYYFRTNDMGMMADGEPLGALVMERCRIDHEPYGDQPFLFSLKFEGEGGKKHFISGRTQAQCQEWVNALRQASYEKLRSQLMVLQAKIQQRTGKDPLKQGSGALAGAYQRDFTTSYPPSPGNQLRAERTIHKVSSVPKDLLQVDWLQ